MHDEAVIDFSPLGNTLEMGHLDFVSVADDAAVPIVRKEPENSNDLTDDECSAGYLGSIW